MEALPRVELTCAEDWEPYSIAFTEKEEEARRRASVAKVRIESQIEEDVEKRSEQRLYPLDFNMESAMDVCVNHSDTIDSYLEHIHTNSLDLSGENLYERMVKCVKVTTDDSDGNGLKEDQDVDNDDSNVADREVLVLNSKDKRSVLTPEILARKWGIGLDAAEQTLNERSGSVLII
jgi:hypothetical protein